MMNAHSPVLERYHPVSVLLHWVLGLLLLGMLVVGWYMTDLPFSPQRIRWYNWHKWAGVLVLALSVLRLLWRVTHRPPALPLAMLAQMPGWQKALHHATHAGLYVLFLAVPLLGWAYSSAAGFPVVWLGRWSLPDWVPVDPAFAEVLKSAHSLAALALAALVLLHVAGVLKHVLVDKDGLMQRMRWNR